MRKGCGAGLRQRISGTPRGLSARPKPSARDAGTLLSSPRAAGPAVPAHSDQVPPLHRSIAGAEALLAAAATAAATAPAQAPQAPGGHGGLTPAPLLSRATPLTPHTCFLGSRSVCDRRGVGGS